MEMVLAPGTRKHAAARDFRPWRDELQKINA